MAAIRRFFQPPPRVRPRDLHGLRCVPVEAFLLRPVPGKPFA